MAVDQWLYEPLSPLGADESSSIEPPPASSDSEPYIVLRNEFSLSRIQFPPPETAATDYFSLDVDADDGEPTEESFPKPPPAETADSGNTLEGSWFRANCRFKSPMLQLHKEILDFCNFLSPTPEEEKSRNLAVERVFDLIKYIWPSCKVDVFGSFKTGLYLPTSDIDVVILGSEIRTPRIGLQALARALSQRGIAKNIQVIAKTRVPIIKFVEKKSSIAFDISFDVQSGPDAAEFIKSATIKWPPLRPLCLVLKIFLQQRALNEVYTGGIGSYALLVMLISMMRSLREQRNCTEQNLGVLLVNFFDFYGRKLNTSDVGVSCKGEGTFFSKSRKGFSVQGRSLLIAIQDPQAPDNDIGKSSFSYFQVKSAFAVACSTLTNTNTILSLGPDKSILGTIIRPDPVLSERKGGSNGEVRFSDLLPGSGGPVHLRFDAQQEIYCNWNFSDDDDEEEPLPRGNHIATDIVAPKKRRKASEEEKIAKKAKKKSEEVEEVRHKESSSKTDKVKKKKKKKDKLKLESQT